MKSEAMPERVAREIVRMWMEDGITVQLIRERFGGKYTRARISWLIKERTGQRRLIVRTLLPSGGEP